MFFAFDSIPNQYKTQEMCDRVVFKGTFIIVFCPGKYKTQRMCDEAAADSLAALKVIRNWFVTCKMIKKFLTDLYTDDDILYFNENSGSIFL